MRQLGFGFLKDYKKEFGGALMIGKRKIARPLSTKKPIHLVIRSELTGVFNPSNQSLKNLIRKLGDKFGVQIYDFALNWSHIHIVFRIRDRSAYRKFIRALTGTLSLKIRKYKPGQKVFNLRPFTRIISWGRDFAGVLNYQVINQLEAAGLFFRKKSSQKGPFTANSG